jgi:hypothetical protein
MSIPYCCLKHKVQGRTSQVDPGGCADTTVEYADPRASAVAERPLRSGLVPSGGNLLLGQLAPDDDHK